MDCKKYWEVYDRATEALSDAQSGFDDADANLDIATENFAVASLGGYSLLGGASAGTAAYVGSSALAGTVIAASSVVTAGAVGIALLAAFAIALDSAKRSFEMSKVAHGKALKKLNDVIKVAEDALDAVCACEAFNRDPKNAQPPPDSEEIDKNIEQEEEEIIGIHASNDEAESSNDEVTELLEEIEDLVDEAEQGEQSDDNLMAVA